MNTSSSDQNTDPTNNTSDNTNTTSDDNNISYLYNGNVMEALRELTSSSSPKQYLFVFITQQSNDQLLINFNNNIQIKQFLLQSNIICINIINNTLDYNNFIAFYNVQSIPSLYVLNKNGINIHFNLNPNLENLINNFNQSINTTTNSNTTTTSINTSNNTVAAAASSSSSSGGSNYDTDIYGEDEVSNNGNVNSDNNQDSRIPQYNYDLINKESNEEKKRKIEEALEKARKRLNRNNSSSSSSITNNSNSNTTTSNSMNEDVMIEEVQTPTTPITPISPFTSSSTNMENENYNRIKKELSFKKKQELEYKKKLKEQIKLDRQNNNNNNNNTPSPSTTNFGNVYNLNNLKNENNSKIDSNSTSSKIESNNSSSSNNLLNKTSNIAFKLPNGQVIKQVFKIQDTIKDLREFKNNNIENGNEYEMILAFPRSLLTSNEYDHLTLENLKLIPSASILLQSNNSTGNSSGNSSGSRSDSVNCEAHSSRSGGGSGLIDTTSRLFTYIIITLISSVQWISSKLFNTNNNNNNNNNGNNANGQDNNSRVNKRNQSLRDNGNSTQFEYPSDDDEQQQDKKNQ